MADKLNVIPLGGLGRIGKNMLVLETSDDMVVIDIGVMFPRDEMLGVDLIIPDVKYVVERQHKLRGILLTHGHEDHTGALPYVLPRLKAPIYCTRLTRSLVAAKLKEHGLLGQTILRVVTPGETINLGNMQVEFIRVSHSIPDSCALAIKTPIGTVFHTGDFKLDHTPVTGEPTDLTRIAEIGRQGVHLLLSDSTYADIRGYTPSEEAVAGVLGKIIADAPGRVIIATFASQISRIQQVIDAAVRQDRQVFVTGRSMLNNVKIALQEGYLRSDRNLLAPLEKMKSIPSERVVVITTGTQGEPMSSLVRMANRDHRRIGIQLGDTVVLSSSPIPGNEAGIYETINNLYRLGAEVFYSRIAEVHVHGHASQEELKLMLNLVKPKFFLPVHGEYRHLVMHGEIARSTGVPEQNIFVLEDGDILELGEQRGKRAGRTSADDVYVDGLGMDIDRTVLRDRAHLARDGIIVAMVTMDKATGKLLGRTHVLSRGFLESGMSDSMIEKMRQVIAESLNGARNMADRADVDGCIHDALAGFIRDETGRRPMILPFTVEV